jgi:hypothetical protein
MNIFMNQIDTFKVQLTEVLFNVSTINCWFMLEEYHLGCSQVCYGSRFSLKSGHKRAAEKKEDSFKDFFRE